MEQQDEEAQGGVSLALLHLFVRGIAAQLVSGLLLQGGKLGGSGVAAGVFHLHQVAVGNVGLAPIIEVVIVTAVINELL